MTKQKQTKKNNLQILLRSIAVVALLAVAGVLVVLYSPVQTSQSALFGVIASLMAIIALYSAAMIFALFSVAAREAVSKKAAKEEDKLLREWLVLVSSVVAVTAVALIPALAMGVFTTDDTSAGQATVIIYLLLFIGLLGGPLIAAGIFAPIKLLVGGTLALVKGDTSKVHQLRLGGAITALTVFCLTTGFAIHPYFSGIGGWSLVILGILGIPGAYDVKSEPLLWVARIVLAIIIVALVASAFRKEPRKKK